jgi:hypothetical protein
MQHKHVQDAADMTEEDMKRIVQECFDELESGSNGDQYRPMRGEKPVSGQKRMQSSIFGYSGSLGSLSMLQEESDENDYVCSVTQVRVRPAMDSGSCDNVIDPDDLPEGCVVVPNTTGKHFRGANDSVIENFGDVETVLESDLGAIGCSWKAAAVSRPLHSVSKVAGPPGGIKNSKQDVLFNNDICVVVPPGIVTEILKRVTPVAQYAREGNLYVGDMVMSSFRRQGPQA